MGGRAPSSNLGGYMMAIWAMVLTLVCARILPLFVEVLSTVSPLVLCKGVTARSPCTCLRQGLQPRGTLCVFPHSRAKIWHVTNQETLLFKSFLFHGVCGLRLHTSPVVPTLMTAVSTTLERLAPSGRGWEIIVQARVIPQSCLLHRLTPEV